MHLHLVLAFIFCSDDRIVSQAIELNEQLQKVLSRHDDLLSGRTITTANNTFDHEDAEEEEEAEQLCRRFLACCFHTNITLDF